MNHDIFLRRHAFDRSALPLMPEQGYRPRILPFAMQHFSWPESVGDSHRRR